MRILFDFLLLALAFSGLGYRRRLRGRKGMGRPLLRGEHAAAARTRSSRRRHLHHQLHQVFGFQHYELLKAEEIELRTRMGAMVRAAQAISSSASNRSRRCPASRSRIDYEITRTASSSPRASTSRARTRRFSSTAPISTKAASFSSSKARPPKGQPDEDDD